MTRDATTSEPTAPRIAELPSVSCDFVRRLIDFAPTEETKRLGFAEDQLEGTVAVFNMLVRNRCAYLADEVGMGKTFVALGVMSLVRYFEPKARIVVIAPRENIQRKWIKELHNFVRQNWKQVGNRVKSLQGGPAWEPVLCGSLLDFAHQVIINADRDFFLRMTSFSLQLRQPENRQRLRRELRKLVPWLRPGALSPKTWDGFRDAFGCALNTVVPYADLVIVDEGHNLKHGFKASGSTRNRVMGFTFGHPEGRDDERPRYRPRASRILLLSATPFEEEYAAIHRQLSIFGFGDAKLRDAAGNSPLELRDLLDRDVSEDKKREIVDRLMVRRVSGLRIGGRMHTKNMYRREWRMGGYESHDDPMALVDVRQRLIVGLMQKKVAEILQSEQFNNHFQIGMLSSFESFLESVATARRSRARARAEEEARSSEGTEDGDEPIFDGRQEATKEERKGIDTDAIADVVESYRRCFGKSLPHPKLDATTQALTGAFDSGEKTLVFVRRVATVRELAAKLDAVFDEWIRNRMEAALPQLHSEITALFELYDQERRSRPEEQFESVPVDRREKEATELLEERSLVDDDDEGSSETFFAWFFRGKGPDGYLSGAAFQKNRLSSTGSLYSTLFEDDHVAWLFGRPDNPLMKLASATDRSHDELVSALKTRAFRHFSRHSRRSQRYPRLYVFESYQAAALELLEEAGGELGHQARVILDERYPGSPGSGEEAEPPSGFPRPDEAIGIITFFTELARRPKLREALWPDDGAEDFRARFRRREQRRELISGMARLGAAYIDLYLLAMEPLGSFALRTQVEASRSDVDLAIRFANLLEAQERTTGLHAYHELSHAAKNFDLLLSVNFPEVPLAPLHEVAAILGATLQRQVPVGNMSGGVNKRLVRQFRMPGFPLVLVTTDVLQEGEDLHTFCRRVVHYGITWTPSAMEQRTGRVDRIGSLVQRDLDGRDLLPDPDEWLQVYYPHLRDTVEVLQVRRVLRRLNRFLQLIHRSIPKQEERSSRIDAAQEMLQELEAIKPIEEPLESAFPVGKEWLRGELTAQDVREPEVEAHLEHLERLWQLFLENHAVEAERDGGFMVLKGMARVIDSRIASRDEGNRATTTKHFELELRSQAAGDATLLRCVSRVGNLDLTDDDTLDHLYDLQRELGLIKVCARRNVRNREDLISVEGDILFSPETTQLGEMEMLISRTVCAAARLRDAIPVDGRSE